MFTKIIWIIILFLLSLFINGIIAGIKVYMSSLNQTSQMVIFKQMLTLCSLIITISFSILIILLLTPEDLEILTSIFDKIGPFKQLFHLQNISWYLLISLGIPILILIFYLYKLQNLILIKNIEFSEDVQFPPIKRKWIKLETYKTIYSKFEKKVVFSILISKYSFYVILLLSFLCSIKNGIFSNNDFLNSKIFSALIFEGSIISLISLCLSYFSLIINKIALFFNIYLEVSNIGEAFITFQWTLGSMKGNQKQIIKVGSFVTMAAAALLNINSTYKEFRGVEFNNLDYKVIHPIMHQIDHHILGVSSSEMQHYIDNWKHLSEEDKLKFCEELHIDPEIKDNPIVFEKRVLSKLGQSVYEPKRIDFKNRFQTKLESSPSFKAASKIDSDRGIDRDSIEE